MPKLPQTPIIAEFPWDFVRVLRCTRDAGSLVIAENLRSNSLGILDARLRCESCGIDYHIRDGIARFLDGELPEEKAHEIAIRDVEWASKPVAFVPPAGLAIGFERLARNPASSGGAVAPGELPRVGTGMW